MRRDAPKLDLLPAGIREMIGDGRATAPSRDLREVLRNIGAPSGPVSDAGTRALQEQRGERA